MSISKGAELVLSNYTIVDISLQSFKLILTFKPAAKNLLSNDFHSNNIIRNRSAISEYFYMTSKSLLFCLFSIYVFDKTLQ